MKRLERKAGERSEDEWNRNRLSEPKSANRQQRSDKYERCAWDIERCACHDW